MKPVEVHLDHVAGAVPSVEAARTMAARWGIEVETMEPTTTGLLPILGYLAAPSFVELLVPIDEALVRQCVAGADQLLTAARQGGGWTAWFVRSSDIEVLATHHRLTIRTLPEKGERPPLVVLPPPVHDGSLPFVISLGEAESTEMARRARIAARQSGNANWRLHSLEVGAKSTALMEYLGPAAETLAVTLSKDQVGVRGVTAMGPNGLVDFTMEHERVD